MSYWHNLSKLVSSHWETLSFYLQKLKKLQNLIDWMSLLIMLDLCVSSSMCHTFFRGLVNFWLPFIGQLSSVIKVSSFGIYPPPPQGDDVIYVQPLSHLFVIIISHLCYCVVIITSHCCYNHHITSHLYCYYHRRLDASDADPDHPQDFIGHWEELMSAQYT